MHIHYTYTQFEMYAIHCCAEFVCMNALPLICRRCEIPNRKCTNTFGCWLVYLQMRIALVHCLMRTHYTVHTHTLTHTLKTLNAHRTKNVRAQYCNCTIFCYCLGTAQQNVRMIRHRIVPVRR